MVELLWQPFLDAFAPPLGLKVPLDPLCTDPPSNQKSFSVRQAPNKATEFNTKSNHNTSIHTTLSPLLFQEDLHSHNCFILHVLCMSFCLNNTMHAYKCDGEGLSTGAGAGIAVTVNPLLPLGVVIDLGVAWYGIKYGQGPAIVRVPVLFILCLHVCIVWVYCIVN